VGAHRFCAHIMNLVLISLQICVDEYHIHLSPFYA
jgi:hypothetical protein